MIEGRFSIFSENDQQFVELNFELDFNNGNVFIMEVQDNGGMLMEEAFWPKGMINHIPFEPNYRSFFSS